MASIPSSNWTEIASDPAGSHFEFVSDHVGDRLRISVSTPPSGAAVPVLYALDPFITLDMVIGLSRLFGSFSGGQIPRVLVVGVGYPTIDPGLVMGLRARDLTPTPQGFPPEFPIRPPYGFGGAEAFLRCLLEEVIPGIESRYDVHPQDRTLIGYSFSGLFGLYTLFHKPESFARYLLVSPSFWWDREIVFAYEQAWADQHPDLPAHVFMCTGEGEEQRGHGWLNEFIPDDVLMTFRQVTNLHRLSERLEGRGYPGLTFASAVLPGEYHLTLFPVGLSQGLRSLFPSDARNA
jgi:predicted alpha/beta superfamily hydrolase